MSGIQDSERLPHSSGSLSDDSNGRGLSRTEESTLTPKPDDEVLLQEGKITGSILQQKLENNSLKCKLFHSMLHLSHSESPEALSPNLLMSLLLEHCMASATVYLILPRAHFSIFAVLRSDWRKRWSRLSDNNKGA